VSYRGISPHVLRLFSDISRRKNSGQIKTFLATNCDRKKSVHGDFSNAILERKMWLKKQDYKVLTRFGGQIQAVHFSGILNCRRWTS